MKKQTTYTAEQLTTIRRKVAILAYNLAQHSGDTQSENMKRAWAEVKANNGLLHILEATKKDGSKMTRVVYTNWNAFNTVKGTGKEKPAGLILLVDAAKLLASKPNTISVYESNITKLAA